MSNLEPPFIEDFPLKHHFFLVRSSIETLSNDEICCFFLGGIWVVRSTMTNLYVCSPQTRLLGWMGKVGSHVTFWARSKKAMVIWLVVWNMFYFP